MTVGEFTGDGTVKLAVTDGQGVFIYEVGRNGIKQVANIPGLTTDNVIALDAADINGNGVAEIFVTNYPQTEDKYRQTRVLCSGYQNGKYVKIWQDVSSTFA
jgi:hypothetical protein